MGFLFASFSLQELNDFVFLSACGQKGRGRKTMNYVRGGCGVWIDGMDRSWMFMDWG